MGEAKKRGSFKERKSAAIKRDNKEREKRVQALAKQERNMTLQERVNRISDRARGIRFYSLLAGLAIGAGINKIQPVNSPEPSAIKPPQAW